MQEKSEETPGFTAGGFFRSTSARNRCPDLGEAALGVTPSDMRNEPCASPGCRRQIPVSRFRPPV